MTIECHWTLMRFLYTLYVSRRDLDINHEIYAFFFITVVKGVSLDNCHAILLLARQPFCGKCSIKSPSILLLVARNQVVVPLIYHLTIFYGPFSIDAVSSRKHFLWTYWGRLSKKAQAISSSFGISKAECFFLCTIFQYQLELGKEHKRYSSHAR